MHKDYGDLPSIICNPGEINQVLLSISVNAIDAISDEEARSQEIFIRTWITEHQHIHIGIKNAGPSIPPEIRSKIFDPFFTTKPIGDGTGLGLAIAYQTMKKHHGSIRLNSTDASGTEFIIDLPLEERPPMQDDSFTTLSAEPTDVELAKLGLARNQKAA